MSKKKQYKPYPYQEECLQKIVETMEAGESRALVVMASGLGKTLTAAFAVERFFAGQKFGRVLILCHSEEILDQTKKKFKIYFGEEKSYGMFTGSHKASDEVRFLFATFQTMKKHRKEFAKDEFDYVIVDEAHHSYATTYFPTIRYFKPKFLLGLTATPDRLDGQDITEIYGESVYELDFVEANDRELMTKCEYRMLLDDLAREELEVYTESEEKLSIKQLNRTLFAPKRDEEIVRIMRQEMANVDDPKMIVFCRTIPHAQKIAKLLGDDTALVHNGQGKTANDLALDAFRDGKIRIIVSVQMLNEGIDVPDANMVVFLRNTVSPTIFYQQLGRGTRLAKDKEKTVVLDFVANCERIKMILQLQKEIEDFRTHKPQEEPTTTKLGDEKPNFTLDIATPEFETKMVDIVELIERASKGREWTKEEIIVALQRLAKELGRTPMLCDLEGRDDMPSAMTIFRLFGSYNAALVQAGLSVNQVRWSKQEIVNVIIEKSVDGIMPPRNIFNNDPKLPNASTVLRVLEADNWAQCAAIVGLKSVIGINRNLNSDQLEDLLTWHSSLYYEESLAVGHWLTSEEIGKNQNLKSDSFYRAHFGSIVHLREEAIRRCATEEGLLVLSTNGKYKMTSGRATDDKYLIDGVIRLTKEVKHKPTIYEIDACDYLPGAGYTCERLGGMARIDEICRLDEVLASIGVKQIRKVRINNTRDGANDRTTFILSPDGGIELRNEKKALLQQFVRKNKRPLKTTDLCGKNGLVSSGAFRRYNIGIVDINRMIGTDEILAELAAEQEQKQEQKSN